MWQQLAEAEKQEALAKKEAETKSLLESREAEFKEKLGKLSDSVKKESEMRVKLQLGAKDRQISSLSNKVADLERQLAEEADDDEAEQGEETAEGDGPVDNNGSPVETGNKKKRRTRANRGRGQQHGVKRTREDAGSNESPSKKAA